nr:MAG: hypothetical protein DIU57_15940 [Pseudomonadota bacterium]
MILWRRKSEGFEWHKHVRTTIRIRREHRRQQLEEARAYALEGLKSAGRAGLAVVGAWLSLIGRLVMSAGHFVGRLARSAANSFQSGILRLIEGLPAVWEGARLYASQALAAAWRIIRRSAEVGAYALLWTSKAVAEIASHGLSAFGAIFSASLVRACGPIQSRGVQPLLIIVGAIATVAALVRLVSAGLSADAILTLVIGLASLLTAALPRLLGVSTTTGESWSAHAQQAWQGGRLTIPRPSIPIPSARTAGGIVAVVLVVTVVVGGGWMILRGASQLVTATASTSLFGRTVTGRAEAVTGDILRINGTEIRLAGIEAPDPEQRCLIPGNHRWRCGIAARTVLGQSVRGQTVTCRISGSDDTGRELGTCLVGDQDVAQRLVRAGLAFAQTGLFAKYDADEEKAREEKVGVWRGKVERPSEYRARIEREMAAAWEAAKRRAPGGCPIKGRIVSGRKYYVLPGTADYHRVRIRTRRGERWFCSEEEAVAAGWKRSPRS